MVGFFAGKIIAVWETIAEYSGQVEIDLIRLNLDYSKFFSLSCRTQIEIIDDISSDMSSRTFAAFNSMSEPWSHEKEFMAQLLEATVRINQEKNAKPYSVPRPWDAKQKKQEEISEEKQAKVMEMLSPVNF